MCGICGFVGGPDRDALLRMRETLVHRGPDEAGEYVDGRVHLAHRRLSVVDLESGQQPFESADGSIVVVFNGEIYNHAELRAELEAKGHVYRTRSDTESIMHAYREYGRQAPEHLDGMFAFVLYDRGSNSILGARDRFGKKPLYYSVEGAGDARTFVFASEIRALLEHPQVRRSARLSEDGLILYLLHDYLPGRSSVYENVRKLLPGHAFSIDLSQASSVEPAQWQYWSNPILSQPAPATSESEAVEVVESLLTAAVERRLMADVPLGVFLSGGVDSTTIVALLTRFLDPPQIRTFSIGFDEPSFDESEHALAAARHYGTDHRSRTFSSGDCLREIDRTLSHLDEPLADPSILPTSLLCGFARETVTVALGGDGGDELFAGYDPFQALSAARAYSALIPDWLDRAAVRPLVKAMPLSDANMSLRFRAERFLRGAKSPQGLRLPSWMGAFSAGNLSALFPGGATRDFAAYLEDETEQFASLARLGADEVQNALAYFQRFYLVDDILVKADRASMQHSLELRSPFLDTDLVEFVNRLPSNWKYNWGKKKRLLKRVVGARRGRVQIVPDRFLTRPKKGFGIPVARWIREELRQTFRNRLVDEWPESLESVDSRGITVLLDGHLSGRQDNSKELWALFVLGEWARRWLR